MYFIIVSFLFTFQSFPGQLNAADLAVINSPYDEQNPVFSPDGETLYFTIGNHPQNVGGVKDPGDIWYSRRNGTQWSAPVHGGKLINSPAHNSVANISGDGNRLFLLSHYDPSGGAAKTQGLSVSSRSGNGWSRPVNISIPYFQNKSTTAGYVTPDGDVFVFSSETYGSYGVEDIYISIKAPDGKWSAPKNLGSKINTQFQELCPSISPDGKTLFFSSNGRKGFGSFDVYYSTRLDDTWFHWSDPVNMGALINTEGRELYYRQIEATSGAAFYTSTISSDGYGDIKLFREKELLIEQDNHTLSANTNASGATDTSETQASPIEEEDHTTDEVSVYGKVLNARSGQSVRATIVFVGARDSCSTQADEDGYNLAILPQDEYSVTISAPGFISTMQKLDVRDYQMKDLEMNFKLQPVEKGLTVNLKSVLFEQSSTDLLPESFQELDLVASFLKENPRVRIELSGHTDSRGVHAHNLRLSKARVDKVKEYLVSRGIDPKRITGRGYGGLHPIAGNDSEETRKLNRRVEFTIRKF